MPDYTRSKIYQLLNSVNDEIYVGSTIEPLHVRLCKHKYDASRLTTPLYNKMRELGKDNFYIELIEEYSCNCRTELLAREGHYIKERGTINKQVAGRTDKEYYEEHKEKWCEYRRENRDHINSKKRELYHNNKNVHNQKQKEYRDNHKEQGKEAHKQWRETNKEHLREYMRMWRSNRNGMKNVNQ